MYLIALKMLLGDRAKYLMLISGLTFASLLMTQQSSVFCGLMRWTTATIRNTRAKVWVVDTKVEQVNEIKAMRDTDLDRVRSVGGVSWAVPMFFSVIQARLNDGSFKSVQLIGLDSSTLFGAPTKITKGNLENILQTNSVLVDQVGIERLSQGQGKELDVGDVLEINDKEARVVGLCETERSFLGMPYVYTTYQRALEYAPKTRKMLSYVLVEPIATMSPEAIARKIERETGLKAYTEDEFLWATIWWYFRNTGIPMSFGTTVLLGVFVGIAVAGQTFYSFILENLRNLGALKAMGVGNMMLARMLILQAFTVGMIGYGMGVGLATLFGHLVLKKGQPPFFMPPQVLVFTFVVVCFICMFSAVLGIRKIASLEPAIVFRG